MNIESLYHFTSVDSLIKILINNNLRLNNIRNMNDIQEKRLLYNSEEFSCINELSRYCAGLSDYQNIFNNSDKEKMLGQIEFPLDITGDYLSDLREHKSYVKKKLREDAKYFRDNIYLCCFNILKADETIWEKGNLWGHYANSHKGVSIKFNYSAIIESHKSMLLRLNNIKKKYLKKKNEIINDYDNFIKINNLRDSNNRIMLLSIEDDIKYYDIKPDFLSLKVNATETFIKYCTEIEKNKSLLEDYLEEGYYSNYLKDNIRFEKQFIKPILKDRYMAKTKEWSNENEFRLLIFDDFTKEKYHILENILPCIEEIIIGDDISNEDLVLLKNLKKYYLKEINIIYSSFYDVTISEDERNDIISKNDELNRVTID